ncbi:MAG: DpnD/PcfM family protein [Lachnospiraceae bacterium]
MESKEFEVFIKELLVRKIKCKADSELEALESVKADYYAGKIVLDAVDFLNRDFQCKEIIL